MNFVDIPVVTEGDGKEFLARINPRLVTSLIPNKITIGYEYPGSKEIDVTTLYVGEQSYHIKSQKINIEELTEIIRQNGA